MSPLSSSLFFNSISIKDYSGYKTSYDGHTFAWSKDVSIAFNVPTTTPDTPAKLSLFYISPSNSLSASTGGYYDTMDSLSYAYIVYGKSMNIPIDSDSGVKSADGKSQSISNTGRHIATDAQSLISGDYELNINQKYSAHMSASHYGSTGETIISSLKWNMQLVFKDEAKNIMDIN